MTTDRESLRRRIAALLAKTVDRGCTEEEAIAAASVAARLMREHGVSEAELQMGNQSVKSRTGGQSPRDALWRVIARCTNTAPIIVAGEGIRRVFVGREPGPAIAVYLYVVCDRAIDRAVREFKGTPTYRRRKTLKSKRQAAHDFVVGMVGRLSMRLTALFADTTSTPAREAAQQALAELYPEARNVAYRQRSVRSHVALTAGYVAGADVNLAHGVNGGEPASLIGGEA